MRSDGRLGAELLRDWLTGVCEGIADQEEIRRGIDLLPGWLHHPGPDKRARTLLMLALVHRRLGAGGHPPGG